MSVKIEYNGSIISVLLIDCLTNEDFILVFEESEKLEHTTTSNPVTSMPNHLIDFRGVTGINISYKEFSPYAAARVKERFPNSYKSAIIATTRFQFGMARLFQVLLEHPQITLAIFKSEEEARAWLASGSTGKTK